MVKQKIKSRPVFFQILFSYFLIMALPMTLLGTLVFGSFLQFYDDELVESRQNSLKQTQVVMDNIVQEMESNASILLNSGNFRTEYLQKEYGNFYDVTRQLATITYTNTFVYAYWYLNSDLQMIFNPETMFTYEKYAQYGVKTSSLNEYSAQELLLKDQLHYWLPLDKDELSGKSFITYVITDKTGKNMPKSSIIFQIDQETINDIIGIHLNSQLDFAMIRWQGEPIYYSDAGFLSEIAPVVRSTSPDSGTFSEKQTIGGRVYMIFYTQSDGNGLEYIYAIPYETLISPIQEMRRSFFIMLVVISLLCSACILYFMNNIYHPVRQISTLVNNIFNGKVSAKDSEDFESAVITLSQIQKEKKENTERKILLQMLSGGFQKYEELELATDETGLQFYGDRFVVILLQIHTNGSLLDPDIYRSIEELWAGSMSVAVSVHFLIFSESTSMVLIAAGDEDAYLEFYQKLSQLKLVTEKRLNLSLTIGVGEEQSLSKIPDSYYQAGKACQYQLFQKDNGVIFFKDIEKAEQWKGMYPTLEIQNLYHAIGQADHDCIALSLQTLLSDMLQTGSLLYCNLLLRDILLTAVKALQEMQCNTDELTALSAENVSAFHKPKELQLFFNMIQDRIERALSDYNKEGTGAEPENKQEPIQEILQYVSQHFYEESLSVKMVADRFGMSVSNLSHYFKKYTGETISEYIARLRFERAKELLRTTDIVLSEICSQCGYLHLSTFMRQFKAREGCTPSVYRAKYRDIEKNDA